VQDRLTVAAVPARPDPGVVPFVVRNGDYW
jgi:hypothetical protein